MWWSIVVACVAFLRNQKSTSVQRDLIASNHVPIPSLVWKLCIIHWWLQWAIRRNALPIKSNFIFFDTACYNSITFLFRFYLSTTWLTMRCLTFVVGSRSTQCSWICWGRSEIVAWQMPWRSKRLILFYRINQRSHDDRIGCEVLVLQHYTISSVSRNYHWNGQSKVNDLKNEIHTKLSCPYGLSQFRRIIVLCHCH